MIILHCMKKADWALARNGDSWGQESVKKERFVHCSPVGYFWRVAPLFKDEAEDLVLVCLDTEKLSSPVKWEDPDGTGRKYPHVYGPLNTSAVTMALPFLRDAKGDFLKNPELGGFPDE